MTLKTANKYFIPITSVMLALLTALSPLAIDTYLAGMPEMAKFFGVGINLVELTLTLYLLGFALGNFFGGPLSDSFGRKTIALTGVILYTISAVIIPFCTHIEYVWGLRITQAFGGGFASVTAMVFVRDWFQGKQVARLATIISMIMMLAPLFAPVIGTYLLKINGWQTIFYFLTVFAIAIFVLFYIIMPESRNKEEMTRQLTVTQLIGKYKVVFSDSRAVMMLLTLSFSVAGMFTFITGASFMYLEYFGFDKKVFPLLFASNVILNVILSLFNTLFLKWKEPEDMLKLGLYFQIVAGTIILVAVQFNEPSFWVIFFSIVLFMGSLGMIFGNGTATILNLMPQVSGSANATIGVSRFVISSIASSIPALFHTGNLKPIGIVMFCCALVANIFFYFFKVKVRNQNLQPVS